MLIINSWFTYKHVKYNLENFGKIINNYIIICATTIHEYEDHPLYISGQYSPPLLKIFQNIHMIIIKKV